ncbi:MAG: hypothetical protein CVV64_02970 [Candidatus Wallbacteria bacterium HGW-Wallbacteria-1]|uniref:histidine kinase n=1 Tax=Candidatus Wallbacteria bacterium HGW-Wallbacteria-1 TaxID=2013854 RepID=A0A2N1PTH2_9BACT|nr:MAG: hypothetical protein CVV64_02970 [Candidatus Wallbacteria bacterium HGW-Wallbacteria-1]
MIPATSGSGLKGKFIFLVTILILIILSLITVTHLVRERKAVILSLTGKARTLTGVISRIIADKTLGNTEFAKLARTILHDEDLQIISVFGVDGEVEFLDGVDENTSDAAKSVMFSALNLSQGRASSPLLLPGTDTFDYLETINPRENQTDANKNFDGKVVWLRLRLDNVNQAIRRIIMENLKVTVVAILFSILMATFLSQVIIQPISLLAEGVRRIIQGDYNASIQVVRNDEIGELGLAFNEMVTKISENRNLEKCLYEQEKLATIGQLAASMAHEVRNPLATVRALNQLVADDLSHMTAQAAHLNLAIEEVDRVNAVIEQFLAYARPRESCFAMEDIAAIIDRVVRLTSPMAQKKGISIETRIPENIKGWVDNEQISQALVNLVMNSLNACSSGNRITIELRTETDGPIRSADERFNRKNLDLALNRQIPDTLIITVGDDGPGVPQSIRDRLFEPFVSSTPHGTGLGLAICRKIAQNHHGVLTLSHKQDKGALFTFRICMAPPVKNRIE